MSTILYLYEHNILIDTFPQFNIVKYKIENTALLKNLLMVVTIGNEINTLIALLPYVWNAYVNNKVPRMFFT